MRLSALLTSFNLDDATPVGTDFVGGAQPLPARPAEPGKVVPGSDFAGGATPLTAEAPEEHAA